MQVEELLQSENFLRRLLLLGRFSSVHTGDNRLRVLRFTCLVLSSSWGADAGSVAKLGRQSFQTKFVFSEKIISKHIATDGGEIDKRFGNFPLIITRLGSLTRRGGNRDKDSLVVEKYD